MRKSQWSTVPLKEVATLLQRPEEVAPDKLYRQIGVRWWGKGIYERDPINGFETRYRRLYRLEKDDIVINKIWTRHGSTAVVTQKFAGLYGSSEFPTYVPDKERLFPRWFHWITQTQWFWHQCAEKSHGTSGKNRIKPEQFLSLEVPLPPLDEQHRIVARIEALAAKVDAARRLREEAQRCSDSLIVSIHQQSEGKEVVSIGDILVLDEDRAAVVAGREYPQVGIRSFGQGLFAKPSLVANQTRYKYFNRLYEGAVVLSQVKGWEGAIAVCGADLAGCYASPEYRTFRCRPQVADHRYLASLVITRWFYSRLNNATHGVGARRQRTRPERFLTLEIPMPSLDQQRQALSIIRKLRAMKPYQTATQAHLDALLPSILDKAFKGEL